MDEKGDQVATTESRKPFPWRMWIFCAMIALALVGMGLTMSMQASAWEYWAFLLAFYGGVSIFWGWQQARAQGAPVWKMVRAQVLHWGCVLAIYGILVAFERTEIINRESTSNVALLLLALACLLAGVHFEWTFLLVGVLLAVMVVALGYLEQYLVWIVMIPAILGAGWAYFQVRKRRKVEHK